MYKELKKIKISGSFHFNADNQLENECNAPNDAPGIFMVYDVNILSREKPKSDSLQQQTAVGKLAYFNWDLSKNYI